MGSAPTTARYSHEMKLAESGLDLLWASAAAVACCVALPLLAQLRALLLGDDLAGDGAGSGVLLVTAHPDDECMFFAPTVLALQASRVL